MDNFDEKRKRAFVKDKSNKGSIDQNAKGIVETINQLENCFTTSSCSGRVTVIKKGNKKTDSKLLFCSHEKIKEPKDIIKSIEKGEVWLLFEPAIFHVCCRTVDDAIWLFNKARLAGFKRTGIISAKNTIIVEIMGTDQLETLLCDDAGTYYTEESLERNIFYANLKFEKNLLKINNFEKLLFEDKKL